MPDDSKKVRQLTRIIESSIKLFSARGYRQTQMSNIAKDMGISPGTLYLYFESKEALFEFVLKYIFLKQDFDEISFPIKSSSNDFGFKILEKEFKSKKPFAQLNEIVHREYVENVAEEFENIIRTLFSTLSTYRSGVTIMLNSVINWPQLTTFYVNVVTDYLELLSDYLSLRINQGLIEKVPDAPAAARFILESTAWFAIHRHRAMYQPNMDDETAEETAVQLLMNAFIRNNSIN